MGANVFGTIIGLVSLIKTRQHGTEKIDTVTFRLHYSFTTALLFLSTALLGMNELFGQDIRCIDSATSGASTAVNQYCWISGTYTVPGKGAFIQGIAPQDRSCKIPGGKSFSTNNGGSLVKSNLEEEPKCKYTHNYYQWVPIVLFLQGLLFLLPWKLWQYLEEGRIKCISNGIRIGEAWWTKTEEKSNVVKKVAKFICMEGAGHKKYALSFIFCTFFNLVNVVLSFHILDLFINGKFHDLGLKWLESGMDEDDTILSNVFPRMTACEFQTFGHGGKIQKTQHLCILAANNVTEKVFVALWFWYILLITLSCVSLIYHVVCILSKGVDMRLFFLELAVNSRKIRKDKKKEKRDNRINNYLDEVDRYRYFLLYFLARNVEYPIMMEILDELAKTDSTEEEDKMATKHEKKLEKRFEEHTPSAPPSAMPQEVSRPFFMQTTLSPGDEDFMPDSPVLQKMANLERRTPVPHVPQPMGQRRATPSMDTRRATPSMDTGTETTLSSQGMEGRGSAIQRITPSPSPRGSSSNLSSSGKVP